LKKSKLGGVPAKKPGERGRGVGKKRGERQAKTGEGRSGLETNASPSKERRAREGGGANGRLGERSPKVGKKPKGGTRQ